MTAPLGIPFEPGQIVVLGVGPADRRRWYRTSVQRLDARLVWLGSETEDQPFVQLQPGETVTCHTWRHMDALYQASAHVAFTQVAPRPLVGLTILGAERIQQREYVRVPLSTVATGLYLGPEARVDKPRPQPLRLTVSDLSAGGLRGRSSLPLAPGDELALDLPLPRDSAPQGTSLPAGPVHLLGRVVALPDLPEPLNLRARVVRLIDPARTEDLTPEIGMVFVDLTRMARERIIHFALEVQRDRRRRGMM